MMRRKGIYCLVNKSLLFFSPEAKQASFCRHIEVVSVEKYKMWGCVFVEIRYNEIKWVHFTLKGAT